MITNFVLILIMLICTIYLISIPAPQHKLNYGPSVALNDDIVTQAMKNVPLSEANYLKSKDLDLESARRKVAYLRIVNPICSQCEWKQKRELLSSTDFIICPDCLCTQYCSKECMKKHKPMHSMWCGKEDGERDMGAQQIITLHVQNFEKDNPEIGIKKWLLHNKVNIKYEDLINCNYTNS